MKLHETQDLFARTMLEHPDAVKNPATDVVALFSCAPEILPDRLEIYRNNIVGSLTEVLLATYPLIKILTGEEFATVMLRSYIIARPPAEACLARYGGALAAFIENFAPAAELPYLADMARLEWAMNEAYSAADDEALQAPELQAVPGDALADLNLRLRDSARLVASAWPLESIRAFCQDYDENTSQTLNLEGAACRLLVCRPALAVEVVALAPDEYAFLTALMQEETLGSAIARTMQDHPAFDFAAILQKHLQLKSLGGFAGGKNMR